jgi:cellulose synthase/poly-beta-1,6-N-acetylglucosamine synthase-like glycosyltransferase
MDNTLATREIALAAARRPASKLETRHVNQRGVRHHGERVQRRGRFVPALLQRLWEQQAANGLCRKNRALSARGGIYLLQWATGLIILAGIAALTVSAPGVLAWLFSTAIGLMFLALIVLRLIASFSPPRWAPRRALTDADLPRDSIIIALYKEARVFRRLVASLKTIDYPADRLEIKFAIEASDTETLAIARACRLDRRFEIIVVPPGTPQTKPRALNYALRFCKGSMVTVHDAEDRPDPSQLRVAAESLMAGGAKLGCVQAPLNWYNRADNWLTRQFALEYAAHFHALLPLYARLGWALPLGGTSNHFNAAALRRAGGWDAYNVTEDADLGFRLHRLGYRCDVISPPTLEEAPIRMWPWVCQRTRWLKGYAQTLAVHSRSLAALKPRGSKPALLLTVGAALLSALAHFPLVVLCVACIASGEFVGMMRFAVPACLSLGYLAAASCAATGMHRAGLSVRLIDLVTMPLYWPLQTAAALRALWQLVTAPYYWDKTEHGLSADSDALCTYPLPQPSSRSRSLPASLRSPPGKPASPRDRKKAHG